MPDAEILLAHDDPFARAYLRGLIERVAGASRCVELGSFNAVIDALGKNNDIRFAVIDLDLPGMASDLGLRFLATHYRNSRIATLFTSMTGDRLEHLADDGVVGFIPKTLPEPALLNAFTSLLDGSLCRPSGSEPTLGLWPPSSENQQFVDPELTERQGEVLRLLALGHSNREIGHMLDIAEGTVKVHVNAAFRVLGVHNRVSAAAAMRKRLEATERNDEVAAG